MIVVEPVKLDASNTETNAPMDNYPQWQEGESVERGDRRIYQSKVYEAARSGSDLSVPGEKKEIPDWLYYGYVNPLRLIDEFIETQTATEGELIIEVEPNELFDVVGLLNVDGSNVKFEIYDDGEQWIELTEHMVDVEVGDWWEYYFTEPKAKKDHVFTNFPSTRVSKIKITVYPRGEGGSSSVGKLIVGRAETIGCAKWGAEVLLINYSKIGRNDFGHVSVVPRSSAKEAKFDVRIDTPSATHAFEIMTRLKDTPCLWIGEQSYGLTIIYGIYDGYRTILRNPRFSSGVLYIKGFI